MIVYNGKEYITDRRKSFRWYDVVDYYFRNTVLAVTFALALASFGVEKDKNQDEKKQPQVEMNQPAITNKQEILPEFPKVKR